MNIAPEKAWIEFYIKDSEKAWHFFINHYNQLMMGVIHKLVNDYDEALDLYTYSVEKLREEDCAKLTKYFEKYPPYNFETWIAVVTRNCCLDWFRKEKGRKRLLKCIKALPELDQHIFRYIYWHKYSYDTTFDLLKSKHNFEDNYDDMLSIIDKIEDTLKHNTRWKLPHEWQSVLPPLSLEDIETGKEKINNSDFSPEELLMQKDPIQILKKILNNLSSEEQLIIQLHYYRDYTLNEIARILKMKNLWRVRRKLQKALKTLKKNLQEKGIDPNDLELF